MDCVPALRLRVMRMLAGASGDVDTSTIALAVRYPTQTTRRALEDLAAHGIVHRLGKGQGKADRWRLSEWTIQRCADAGIVFPEMSEDKEIEDVPEMSEEA
jgi:DNA-binding IclR family transcriptional regulator